jgi:hypothetical protein
MPSYINMEAMAMGMGQVAQTPVFKETVEEIMLPCQMILPLTLRRYKMVALILSI